MAATTVSTSPGKMFVTVLKVLFILGVLYQLSLLLRPDQAFMSRPFFEDSFYTFSVARSLANGHGLSVDGEHLTNGIQPLISFLYVPVFAISGDNAALALRLILALQIAIFAGTALVAGWFMKSLYRVEKWRQEIFWLVAVFIFWNYTLSTLLLNGLETGLAVGLIFAAGGLYNRFVAGRKEVQTKYLVLLGSLLGLGVLCRIDIGFLVASIILWMFVQAHRKYSTLPFPQRLKMFNRTVWYTFIVGAMSVIISLPWWIYNYTEFGSLLPISGQSQQVLIPDTLLNVNAAVQVLSDAFFLIVHTPLRTTFHINTIIGISLILFAVLVVIALPQGRRTFSQTRRQWSHMWNGSYFMPLAIFSVVLVIFYTFFFGAPHFIPRYLVLPRILIGLIVVSFIYTWCRSIAPAIAGKRLGLAAFTLSMIACTILFMRHFTNEVGNPLMIPAKWIEEHTTSTDRIGMFQSGTTGFLFSNVRNLDGKVNAHALHALQTGTMPQYVDSVAFDYIIDWDFYTQHVFNDPAVKAHYQVVDSLDQDFIVWSRIESGSMHN